MELPIFPWQVYLPEKRWAMRRVPQVHVSGSWTIMELTVPGKKAVIVGRSLVVGKPVSMMLLKKNATITVCHTKTKNIKQEVQAADIVVAKRKCRIYKERTSKNGTGCY